MTSTFDLNRKIRRPFFPAFATVAALAIAGVSRAQLVPPPVGPQPVASSPTASRNLGAPGPHLDFYSEFYNPVNSHSRDITMTALTAEYEYRPARPSLRPFSLGLIGSLYRPEGTSYPDADDRASGLEVSAMGLSVGFMARFYMIETPRFEWFTEYSGALAYWTHPFPPNGTPWDGIQRFGTGIKARVSDGWALMAGIREFHNSNGGGFVEHNPAYDGLGGYLGMSYVPGGQIHDRAIAKAKATDSPTNSSAGAVFEYFASRQAENDQVDLYTITSEYEYRPPVLPWLALTGSMSLYRADGQRPDPNRGLGEFNAGSVGYGFNLGVRPIWQVTGRFALFAEAIGGVQRFTRAFPTRSDGGRLYEPWTFPKSVRYGAGVRWQVDESTEVIGGYRHLNMDTSLDRPGDAPDYEAQGLFVGVMRTF